MSLLRVALGNPRLARLEAVWAMAALVKWALAILVALYAYRHGGAAAVGLAGVARMVPAALLTPRLSVLADHRSRRVVLMASLVARLVLALGLWVAIRGDASLAVVLTLAAGFGVADALQKPTQAALFGVHAHNPTELAAANALWSMLDNAAFVVGSVLVGAFVAITNLTTAYAVCVLPLVVALALVAGLERDVAPPPLPDVTAHDELLAGVKVVRGNRELGLLTGILAADMFVQAIVDVLLVVVAVSLLGAGEAWAGWLSASWGVGGVIGGVAAAVLLARRRIGPALLGGLILAGLPLTALALWPEQAAAVGLFAGVGVGFGVLEVVLLTLTQRLVPADVMARVYGVQETVTIIAMAAGALVASGLVAWLGERGALVATGAILPLMALALVGRLGLLSRATGSDADYELFRGVEPFATLPVATVENLAMRATRVQVPAGEHVIRQGEPGDAFYVIEAGEVDVHQDGVFRRQEGRGDYFGEIALLRESARTASVRALTPLALLALSRADFLAAIEHPRARHVLNRTATSRLDAGLPGPRPDPERPDAPSGG